MQNDPAFDSSVTLARAIDQLKLMRSALQRIASSTGKTISPTEPSNESNFIDAEEEALEPLTELTQDN